MADPLRLNDLFSVTSMPLPVDKTLQAPFPYFGGKRRAASIVWQALGDPAGYVEPFCGSAAVLLARPPFKGRRVETLNDADGWLVNAWRSLQLDPDAVAKHAGGPVTEIDYHARLAWLQQRRTPELVSWLEGDPEHHDPKAAGWWLYVCACGIGDPWGPGPWHVVSGHLVKGRDRQGVQRELPHLGDSGQGVNRELPHLGDAGKGVNRELPHLGDSGQGDGLTAYLRALSARLARVRITCGDWRRVLKPSVMRSGTGGDGAQSVFLDPPYSIGADLYAETGHGISEEVRAWCETAPRGLRIVLAGYDNEHDPLLEHGWSVCQGKAGRGAGYSTNGLNGRRERLWLSPACIGTQQTSLLEVVGFPGEWTA